MPEFILNMPNKKDINLTSKIKKCTSEEDIKKVLCDAMQVGNKMNLLTLKKDKLK